MRPREVTSPVFRQSKLGTGTGWYLGRYSVKNHASLPERGLDYEAYGTAGFTGKFCKTYLPAERSGGGSGSGSSESFCWIPTSLLQLLGG